MNRRIILGILLALVLISGVASVGMDNRGKVFEAMPLAQWQETIGVNLFGTVKVTQAVVPFMREQKWDGSSPFPATWSLIV
ncbi:MAG: SDR family NAD(P)-dependent oxidoreductase [Anaerolineae bacterium]|nr:SDR family NAD(P)-dependent oxidoreductase [Anaerolineae bacterium]